MARKKFTIEKKFSEGFSSTENEQERFVSSFENLTLQISKVVPDPTNPRQLLIKAKQLIDIVKILKEGGLETGITLANRAAKDYLKNSTKTPELVSQLEKILELASSIDRVGLIHPPVTYKELDIYNLVAGESRYLAMVMLGKDYIDSRVFSKKPTDLDIKLAQFVENIRRNDLSPYSKVLNVIQIKERFEQQKEGELSSAKLAELTGGGKTMSSYYLALTNAPQDVLDALEKNKIKNIKKAVEIAKESDPAVRVSMIHAEDSIDSILENRPPRQTKKIKSSQAGRKPSKISLGSTKNTKVIRNIIDSVVSTNKFVQFDKQLEKVDWTNMSELTKLFQNLMKELEKRIK